MNLDSDISRDLSTAENIGYVLDEGLTRTRYQRLKRLLFPERYCELPEAPSNWEDVIHHDVNGFLDWKDRIRVFITGHIITRSKIVTEHKAGATKSGAVVFVGRGNKHEFR